MPVTALALALAAAVLHASWNQLVRVREDSEAATAFAVAVMVVAILRERVGLARLAGAVLVAAGVALLALA